jgi:mannosyltransferase
MSAGQQARDTRPAELPARQAARPRSATVASYAAILTPAAVMALLGIWRLARDSAMGNDEVATRYAALLSLRQLARLLRHVDAVHGFYYLLMHGWIAVGSSPEVLRIPSVLAMIAAVAMIAILARRLSGSDLTALFAGLITALTPPISYYAQTARSYALVFACVVGSTLALLQVLAAETSPSRTRGLVARRWLLYGALVVLGGYLNEMSLLVLAAHATTILLARCDREIVFRYVAAAGASVVVVAPLAVISSRQGAAIAWIPPPNPASARLLVHDYFGATLAAAVLVFACAAVGALRPRWWRVRALSLPSVALPLLCVPAFLLIAESFVARPLYVDRYVLYGEAGAAMLAAAGLAWTGQRLREAGWRLPAWVPGAIACLCVLLLQITPQLRVRTPQSRLYDFGGPARYIEANARAGDGVLFFDAFYRKDRLGYPQDFRKTSDFALAVSPEQAGTFQGADKPFALVRPLMLDRQRIWVIGVRPSHSLPEVLLRKESLALERDFTKVAQRHFKGIFVTFWVRR